MKRLIVLLMFLATPLWAVEPAEMLSDPAQEARARELSKGLRCLVCRNESIDDSNAELAQELRVLVRERITAGDSDDQVMDYVVDRYGEYVLLQPTLSGSNLVLWVTGPMMLVLALLIGFFYLRARRSGPRGPQALSPAEQARLREILED